MNKNIFIAIIGFCATVFVLIIFAIILSFTFLKRNTDQLIKIQRDKLVSLIRIPNAIPPSNPSFYSIRYTWEMETLQNEVATVDVTQTTGFSKGENSILIVLDKTAAGDESIFDKILPAVVVDEEVLSAIDSQEKISHLENGETGFKSVKIERNNANDKVINITWEFEKNNFGENAKDYFKKFNYLPEPAVKILYFLQSAIILSLSGQ